MAKKTAVSQEVREHADGLRNQAKELLRASGILDAKAATLCDEAKSLDAMADKWEKTQGD